MSDKEVIIVKLDALKELFETKFENNEKAHKQTNDHLLKLNGQTTKNTEFRLTMGTKMKTFLWIGGILVPLVVSAAVNKFL